MLIALISDIHANLQALMAVVKHARERNIDAFWCLGDVLGRGPAPFEVWDELTRFVKPPCWVAGNHDWSITGIIQDDGDFNNPGDWIAIRRQIKDLQNTGRHEEVVRTINEMPVLLSPLNGVYLAHASFGKFKRAEMHWDCVNHYLMDHDGLSAFDWAMLSLGMLRSFVNAPFEHSRYKMENRTGGWTVPRVLIVGHTHIRDLIWLRKGHPQEQVKVDQWYDLTPRAEIPVLINPGSVGFARGYEYDHCAGYALLEWDEQHPRICFYRVPYDRPEMLKWIEERKYPALIKTLVDGPCSHSYQCACGVLK